MIAMPPSADGEIVRRWPRRRARDAKNDGEHAIDAPSDIRRSVAAPSHPLALRSRAVSRSMRGLNQYVGLSRHPTLPSSEMPISFCVSAMNSIGRCCSTSRTKPLTTRAIASSCDSPRWRQ